MSRLWSKFTLFEKSRTIEISRIYAISLTKISTGWVCVLHHGLNHSVEAKTGIRNSLINSWFVKLFINYHGITKANFIFWITCSSIWNSTNHLIHTSSCCIYTTWLWNSSIAATCTLYNSNLFSLWFHNRVLGALILKNPVLCKHIFLILINISFFLFTRNLLVN